MSSISFLLAEVGLEEVVAPWRSINPSILSGLIVVGAIGLVSLLAVLWAVFFRKTKRRRRSRHHAHGHSSTPNELPATGPDNERPAASEPGHRKWRRSRHRHHSRNPTLAETGGLPRARPEDATDPHA